MNRNPDKTTNTEDTTHFGFQTVEKEQKAGLVANVFHSVASRYDLMNDLMSLGIHRLWKRSTLEYSKIRAGDKVLDLAGGTGDLSRLFSKAVGSDGLVILSDINNSMLALGRDRLIDSGCMNNCAVAQIDAQSLPFAEGTFDCITIGFGLRNVTEKLTALQSIHRRLNDSGRLLVLEFSKPVDPTIGKIYDEYSFSILPKIGKVVADDEDSYRYLAESIRMHPDQESLRDLILEAGFSRCEYHNFTGGIVALHVAHK